MMSGTILIIDDVATNRIVYRARLAAAFYEPQLASSGQQGLSMAQDLLPDLILLDYGLPDMSGQEVLRKLRANARTRDIPVIVLTAAQDPDVRLAAFSAGADDVIIKPAAEHVLLARVRNLLRSRVDSDFVAADVLSAPGFAEPVSAFEPGGTVAVVTNQTDHARRLQHDLSGMLKDRLVVLSRPQALAEAAMAQTAAGVPDVFIVQDDPAEPSGALRLLSELKSHQATRHSAVCVLSRAAQPDDAAMAFDLGADDVVDPDVSPTELALRTRSLMRRKRQGDRQRARMQDSLRLSLVDPLTGLYNRRYALPQLAAIARQAAEAGATFAVMVVDLDRFKLVNDQFGHTAGDQVLVEVSRRLSSSLRTSDLLARIGGEEFLVVLPLCSMAEARRIAERLCAVVDERPVRLASGTALSVTVSIGVAVSGLGDDDQGAINRVVEAADLALLDSKGSGRNQVTFRLSAA
ncbi:MAG: diguanylate cyclase [Tabrizicola sp.]|jgi:two-component system cell cycle response regulator|nr:diguanylate cyclase [Tabrizicola sp.]